MDILNITKNGILKRVDNSLQFILSNGHKIKIPIVKINVINIYSHIDFNSDLILFLSKNNIKINFFQPFSGNYYCSLGNQNSKGDSFISLKQFEEYSYNRLYWIEKFYNGIINNMIYVLMKYKNSRHSKKVYTIKSNIDILSKNIYNSKNTNEFMLNEARIWNEFYQLLDIVLIKYFKFEKRTKRPPENEVNILISFLNMNLYSLINNTIQRTQLDNRIGFIHELHGKRYSLVLDIADMFKPYYVIYFIINSINTKQITKKYFDSKIKLNDNGITNLLKLYSNFLNNTVYSKHLKRNISMKYLIQLECYKIVKYLFNNKYEYEPFYIGNYL